jgi:hypothetical protein
VVFLANIKQNNNTPFEGPTVTNEDEEEASSPFHRALKRGMPEKINRDAKNPQETLGTIIRQE